MSFLKSFDWTLEHLDHPSVRIVDCRFQLSNSKVGAESYTVSHLPNAVYLNLEKDLSGPVKQHGGRHPLPDLDELSETLSRLGIDENVTVVAYDDQNGAMASRLWWILQYLGHQNSFVLNGSYQSWRQKGLPVDSAIPAFERRNFKPQPRLDMMATVHDVRDSLENRDIALIDSREEKRFKGIEEPIDKVAGHIPGALHYFWQDSLQQDGSWNEKNVLEERFQDLSKNQPIIVYCGSGVTACPNVLALKEAGFQDVKLYVGSWSDWISYSDHPIDPR
jgi:thiosulfate/3-mercaptopyruvate sulfurtransferase